MQTTCPTCGSFPVRTQLQNGALTFFCGQGHSWSGGPLPVGTPFQITQSVQGGMVAGQNLGTEIAQAVSAAMAQAEQAQGAWSHMITQAQQVKALTDAAEAVVDAAATAGESSSGMAVIPSRLMDALQQAVAALHATPITVTQSSTVVETPQQVPPQ